jgi:hypothetical protein
MRISLVAVVLLLTLFQAGLAESPLALVTDVKGQATRGEESLQLLTYLHAGDKATVSEEGKLVISYVEGGLRATVDGPCVVEIRKDGPVKVSGTKQAHHQQAPERVGYKLPSNVDLGNPGATRRGELSLHISRKMLPGEQEIKFSAIPALSDFQLTISDANSYEEVYAEETEHGRSFTIPEGVLKAGRTYEFRLASSGGLEIQTDQPIAVLSDDLAARIGKRLAERDGALSIPAKVELLAICEQYNLDHRALELVQELLKEVGPSQRLVKDQKKLRALLDYED